MDEMLEYSSPESRRQPRGVPGKWIVVPAALFGLVLIFGSGRTICTKENATTASLAGLRQALKAFDVDYRRYPTTVEGLQFLRTPPPSSADPAPHAYIDEVPLDGWGTELRYQWPSTRGKDFDLYSAGPDRIFGTADDMYAD